MDELENRQKTIHQRIENLVDRLRMVKFQLE
jgi:hypothetical protein